MHYDTTQRSDSKYWAINTATPTIGVPVTIYWAAPFRADTNIASHIPTYTSGTRSNTQAVVDLFGGKTVTANSLTYAIDNSFSFNGSSDYLTLPITTDLCNISFWIYNNNAVPNNDAAIGGPSTYQSLCGFNGAATYGVNLGGWTGGATNEAFHIWSATPGGTMTYNREYAAVGWHHVIFNWNGTQYDIWLDGVKTTTYAHSGGHAKLVSLTSLAIGRGYIENYFFNGKIAIVKVYNRSLTDIENTRNFIATKGRFGL
jgi:hypothetical protein